MNQLACWFINFLFCDAGWASPWAQSMLDSDRNEFVSVQVGGLCPEQWQIGACAILAVGQPSVP